MSEKYMCRVRVRLYDAADDVYYAPRPADTARHVCVFASSTADARRGFAETSMQANKCLVQELGIVASANSCRGTFSWPAAHTPMQVFPYPSVTGFAV